MEKPTQVEKRRPHSAQRRRQEQDGERLDGCLSSGLSGREGGEEEEEEGGEVEGVAAALPGACEEKGTSDVKAPGRAGTVRSGTSGKTPCPCCLY